MPRPRIEALTLVAAIAASACGPTTPAPETSEPTPIVFTATGRPSEAPPPPKTPEQKASEGWTRFRSLNYPYEIEYPLTWTAASTTRSNKKIDLFQGDTIASFQTNVTVLAEPVESWVRFDDYRKNIEEQLNQVIMTARRGAGGPLVGGGVTRIAGQEAVVLFGRMPQNAILFNPEYEFRTAVFILDGRGWQITLACSPAIISVEEPRFSKMLSTIKFIK